MRAHLLSAEQFNPEGLLETYKQAYDLELNERNGEFNHELAKSYAGRSVVVAMLEDSTRTAGSFLRAASRIGVAADYITARGLKTSVGETDEATAAMWAGNHDVVVLRAGIDGAVANLATYADTLHDTYGDGVADGLFINAGDGKNEHPTQAELDGYTLWKQFGTLNGLHHVLGGDLNYSRTLPSYVKLTSQFDGASYTLLTPPDAPISQEILGHLETSGVEYRVTSDKFGALEEADAAVMARPQKERTGSTEIEIPVIQLCARGLAVMKEGAIALHAMPFSHAELAPDAETHPKNFMWIQAANGRRIRAQRLREVLDGTQTYTPLTEAQQAKQLAIYERALEQEKQKQQQQLVAA